MGWGRGLWARWALGLLLATLTGLAPLGRAQAGLNIWTSGGPEGGVISVLAIDPTTPGTLYAAGTGAFKSATGGSIWIPINTGLGTTPVLRALAIDPQTPSTLYAGTLLDGVFKSTDGGASWSPLNTGLTNTLVLALVLNPSGTCLHAGTVAGVFDLAAQIDPECPSLPTQVASVLPSGRSVQVGTAATVFATILNGGPGTALGCRIASVTPLPATFTYQTTDPATNALTATPNTPANIPAGGGQSFVFALTPTSPIAPTDVLLSFACTNAAPAPTFVGVSTLFLVAAATPVPDPVALAATPTHDGILTLASAGAFAMATVNVGASALLTVTPDTGGASLPLTLSICQTDAGANCLAPPAPSVTTQINAGATPTFSIFALGTGPIPFLPGTNRIFVRFTDQGGVIRGATSVAVRTP